MDQELRVQHQTQPKFKNKKTKNEINPISQQFKALRCQREDITLSTAWTDVRARQQKEAAVDNLSENNEKGPLFSQTDIRTLSKATLGKHFYFIYRDRIERDTAFSLSLIHI